MTSEKRYLKTKFGNDEKEQVVTKAVFSPKQGVRYEGELFTSYSSNIAFKSGNKVFLDAKYWNFSATTNAYRGQFLGEGIAETRKKITSGFYTLTNLNK